MPALGNQENPVGRFTTEYTEHTEEKQNRQMDTESAYKSGDVIELWVNGQPAGQTVVIGKTGEARELDF